MILLAAIGSITLLRLTPTLPLKSLLLILLIAGAIHLGIQSHRANTRFAADPRNPYVYAHTGTDVFELVNRVEQIAAIHPARRNMLIYVITDYCWPLPWYLRQYPNVGYYPARIPPPHPDAPFLIVSSTLTSTLDPALHQKYWTELYGLRPDAHLQAYIQQDLWSLFLQSRTPKKPSNPPPTPFDKLPSSPDP